MKRDEVWSVMLKRTSDEFGSLAGLEMPLQNALSSKVSAAACASMVFEAKMNVDMI